MTCDTADSVLEHELALRHPLGAVLLSCGGKSRRECSIVQSPIIQPAGEAESLLGQVRIRVLSLINKYWRTLALGSITSLEGLSSELTRLDVRAVDFFFCPLIGSPQHAGQGAFFGVTKAASIAAHLSRLPWLTSLRLELFESLPGATLARQRAAAEVVVLLQEGVHGRANGLRWWNCE